MTDNGINEANLPAKRLPERVVVNQAGDAAAGEIASTGQAMMGALRIGAGALAKTVSRMLLLGVVLAIAAGRIAGEMSGTAGFLAVLLTLAITVVMGFVLAWQRAGLLALAEAVEGSGIASRVLKTVFARVIGEDDDGGIRQDEHGRISRTVGRTPRSEAELRLRDAVAAADPELQASGLLAGVFQRARGILVGTIHRLSLEEFRRDDAEGGGVDLVKVRERIAERIGTSAASAIRQRARWITIGFVTLTVVITLAAAWGLRQLFA